MKVSRALVPTVAFATVATAAEVFALVWLNHVSTPATKPVPPRRAIQMAVPVSTPPPKTQQPKVEQVEPVSSQLAPVPALPSPPLAPMPAFAPTMLGFDLPSLGTGGLVLRTGDPSASGQTLPATPPPAVGPTRTALPKRRPPPRYPPRAAARGIEGEVVLRVSVDAKGRVTAADVVRASPPGVFDDAAVAAARRYRFEPALENGVATAVTLEQRILFRVPK